MKYVLAMGALVLSQMAMPAQENDFVNVPSRYKGSMRLTISQKRLLCLAHQAGGWMEVFSKEARTITSLESQGLAVVHSDRRSLVLTDLGNQIAALVKAGWKPQ